MKTRGNRAWLRVELTPLGHTTYRQTEIRSYAETDAIRRKRQKTGYPTGNILYDCQEEVQSDKKSVSDKNTSNSVSQDDTQGKKGKKKSRECHNHKLQPFPDTKRKRKHTKPNKRKSNKRTKSTKINFTSSGREIKVPKKYDEFVMK